MQYLWHDIMNYIWEALLVIGFIFGAIIWVAMAVWDSIRGIGRRINGEVQPDSDGTSGLPL